MKEIDLENMSGGDFETLCKEIFSKYYKVEVEQTALVGDGGKDLIIRTPVPIYVECKHHRNTIGRPVVQKLHSAMTTDFVKKGIVVTTGKFSPQAIEHVRINNLPIELIDGDQLGRMAESVGIKLYFGYDVNIAEYIVVPKTDDEISKIFWNQMGASIKTAPAGIQDYVRITSISHYATPFYCYDFILKQDFTNQKKDRLYMSLNEHGKFLLEFDTLRPAKGPMPDYVRRAHMVPLSETEWEVSAPVDSHIRVDIEASAYEGIIEAFTTEVSYRTNKGDKRVKKIVPSKSHIQLSNLRIVYYGQTFVSADFGGRSIEASTQPETGHQLKIRFATEFQPDPSNPAIICDKCRKIYRAKEGKTCNVCGRILCKDCSLKYKTGLLSSAPICEICAKEHPEYKIKRYVVARRSVCS